MQHYAFLIILDIKIYTVNFLPPFTYWKLTIEDTYETDIKKSLDIICYRKNRFKFVISLSYVIFHTSKYTIESNPHCTGHIWQILQHITALLQ